MVNRTINLLIQKRFTEVNVIVNLSIVIDYVDFRFRLSLRQDVRRKEIDTHQKEKRQRRSSNGHKLQVYRPSTTASLSARHGPEGGDSTIGHRDYGYEVNGDGRPSGAMVEEHIGAPLQSLTSHGTCGLLYDRSITAIVNIERMQGSSDELEFRVQKELT